MRIKAIIQLFFFIIVKYIVYKSLPTLVAPKGDSYKLYFLAISIRTGNTQIQFRLINII